MGKKRIAEEARFKIGRILEANELITAKRQLNIEILNCRKAWKKTGNSSYKDALEKFKIAKKLI